MIVLSRVQLTPNRTHPSANAMLIQVPNMVSVSKLLKFCESGLYKSVLQRDLCELIQCSKFPDIGSVV